MEPVSAGGPAPAPSVPLAANATPTAATAPPLTAGAMVDVRVLQALSAGRFLVALGDTEFVATSESELKPGTQVRLSVAQAAIDGVVLRLAEPVTTTISAAPQRQAALNLPAGPAAAAVLAAFEEAGAPLEPLRLQAAVRAATAPAAPPRTAQAHALLARAGLPATPALLGVALRAAEERLPDVAAEMGGTRPTTSATRTAAGPEQTAKPAPRAILPITLPNADDGAPAIRRIFALAGVHPAPEGSGDGVPPRAEARGPGSDQPTAPPTQRPVPDLPTGPRASARGEPPPQRPVSDQPAGPQAPARAEPPAQRPVPPAVLVPDQPTGPRASARVEPPAPATRPAASTMPTGTSGATAPAAERAPAPASQQPAAPAASDQRPATSGLQPAASDQRPATSDQQPATTGQQPAATGQRPAASGQRPAASGQQPAPIGPQPSSRPQPPAATGQPLPAPSVGATSSSSSQQPVAQPRPAGAVASDPQPVIQSRPAAPVAASDPQPVVQPRPAGSAPAAQPATTGSRPAPAGPATRPSLIRDIVRLVTEPAEPLPEAAPPDADVATSPAARHAAQHTAPAPAPALAARSAQAPPPPAAPAPEATAAAPASPAPTSPLEETVARTVREHLAEQVFKPKELADYDRVVPLPLSAQQVTTPARLAVASRSTGGGAQATFVRVDAELTRLGPVSIRLSGADGGGPLAITLIASRPSGAALSEELPALIDDLRGLGLDASVRVVADD